MHVLPQLVMDLVTAGLSSWQSAPHTYLILFAKALHLPQRPRAGGDGANATPQAWCMDLGHEAMLGAIRRARAPALSVLLASFER